MRHYLYTILLAATFLFSSWNLYAQRDVETFLYGNSLQKITSIFGNPLEKDGFDGDGGYVITVKYNDFYATMLKDHEVGGIILFTDKLCVLSSAIPGGIKVGDRMSKYSDVDFTSILTGRHYEANGFLKLPEPYKVYPSKRTYNYGILSKGIPYVLRFAVEDGVIKEIYLNYLQDYTTPEELEKT